MKRFEMYAVRPTGSSIGLALSGEMTAHWPKSRLSSVAACIRRHGISALRRTDRLVINLRSCLRARQPGAHCIEWSYRLPPCIGYELVGCYSASTMLKKCVIDVEERKRKLSGGTEAFIGACQGCDFLHHNKRHVSKRGVEEPITLERLRLTCEE